jgi:hypothetical protein
MRFGQISGLVLVFVLAAGGAAAAGAAVKGAQLAQLGPNGAPGIINSVDFRPVDPLAEITVRPLDDGKESLEIKRRFDGALQQSGYKVSDYTADTELSFETAVIEGRFSDGGRNMGRFEGSSDRGVNFRLNLWSSTEDSVLGGRQKRDGRQANVFHMNAVLRDRSSGAILWQADAFCEMLTPDTGRIAASVIPPLVESIGQTVKGRPFDIQ